MKILRILLVLILMACNVHCYTQNNPGDSITVQCFDFEDISSRRDWFEFPSEQSWHKILMYYTIKCDPQTPYDGYACGEWDYTTFTHVYHRTGNLDSTHYTHPNFIANGLSPDSLNYGNQIAWNYYPRLVQEWEITDTNNLNSITIGSGNNQTLIGSDNDSRSFMLYSEEELTNQSLQAGTIQRIKIPFSETNIEFHNFKMRIKQTNQTSLNMNIDEWNGGETMFFASDISTENGWIDALLYPGFDWDGESSVLIDLSWEEQSTSAEILTDNHAETRLLTSYMNDKHLEFDGPDYVDIPADAFANIDEKISICMWIKGDENFQPQSDMLFEGFDENGQRVVNVHLPWENGNVYWDAGNDAGSSYDRIYQSCDAELYSGSWNHWAFVKDATTGIMEIYINGELWLSGTGKNRSMAGITGFYLGGNRTKNHSRFYDGAIDDFQIFDVALSGEDIQSIINEEFDEAHSQWDNLIVSYDMNESDLLDGVIHDNSGNNFHAVAIGMPQIKLYSSERFKDFESFSQQAQIIFEQGDFVQEENSYYVTDSTPADLICLQSFQVINYRLFPVDTMYVYSDYYRYFYNSETGSLLDSIYVSAQNTIHLDIMDYYSEPFDEILTIQLQNFVTPYGINLNLGNDGFTYVYDVTEYAPFLHDSVDIQAHNTQELLDLKFVFIEGTPPADLINFNQLWRGNYSQHAIAEDEVLPGVKIKINENTEKAVVRTRTTGHGMSGSGNCAEFCPTVHNLYIDNVEAYSWQNWTECADNPVFPQGGTWIFDRAGWCPGSFADTYNWDVSDYLNSGDSVEIDYGMIQYPSGDGEGNYQLTVQLLEYGAPNFMIDAGLVDIIKPSNEDRFRRFNPICGQPEIRIQNTGAENLTSLVVEYGLDGEFDYTFNWTGDLEFMKTETVELPPLNWKEVVESNGNFYVRISQPNGSLDEFGGNNIMKSEFDIVDVFDKRLVFVLKTNNVPSETSYEILDANGAIISSGDNFQANTYYYDTLPELPGCYELRLYDDGGDGLNFWYNTSAGSGSSGIKFVNSVYAKTFPSDFGNFIRYQFVIPDSDFILDQFANGDYIDVYPNPAKDHVYIDLKKVFDDKVILQICDMFGKQIKEISYSAKDYKTYKVDINDFPAGMYMVRVVNGKMTQTRKLIIN